MLRGEVEKLSFTSHVIWYSYGFVRGIKRAIESTSLSCRNEFNDCILPKVVYSFSELSDLSYLISESVKTTVFALSKTTKQTRGVVTLTEEITT